MNDPTLTRALGNLEGTVKAMADQWRAQEASATAGRRALHEKIDELTAAQGKTSHQLGQLTTEFAEIKPAVKRFEAERQRREGAKSLGKTLWIGITAFATGIGYLVNGWVHSGWPPKH